MNQYKVIVLGESGTGKSSILQRYIENSFNANQISSIGVDWFEKSLFIEKNEKEVEIRLMLWDSSGEERFRSLAPSYCKNSNVVLLTFDLTDENSIQELKYWRQEAEIATDAVYVLVGNKADLEPIVEPQLIDEVKLSLNCIAYYEVSALTGENIEELFRNVADIAYEHVKIKKSASNIIETAEVVKDKSCC